MSWIDNLSQSAKQLISSGKQSTGNTGSWLDSLSEGAKRMIIPQTPIAEKGSQLEQVMQSGQKAGQELKTKIGQPLSEKIFGFAKKAVPALSEPGTTFVTPQLKKMGMSPLLAGGIGLGLDVAMPGQEGEIKAGKKLSDISISDKKILDDAKKGIEIFIRNVGKKEFKEINTLGFHNIKQNSPIVYDKGAAIHFEKTIGNKSKTDRLFPSETFNVIKNPDDIFPNFEKGGKDSYLYLKKIDKNNIAIVQVINDGAKLRISHGGFKLKDDDYLAAFKKIKKALLEGRQ